MMRKVAIISQCEFPRGSATSNYIQYLALACQAAGYSVTIISNLNEEYPFEKENGKYRYNSFEIVPYKDANDGFLRKAFYKVFEESSIHSLLKKSGISEGDFVIVYSQEASFHRKLINLRRKMGFQLVGCITEWFPDSYFANKKRAEQYRIYFEKMMPQYDLLLPISTYINDYYVDKGVPTLCLPIMADVAEYKINSGKSFDTMKYIFPANGKMKDQLSEMIHAFYLFLKESNKKIELHLCGVKAETVDSVLTDEEKRGLGTSIVIHSWLKYDELIALYNEMHFLLLARDDTQITRANFPSKVPELLTYGVVPIVSKVGDYTQYYLDKNNSIIFEGYKQSEILMALRRSAALDKKDYMLMSKNARKCAETRFDYHVWTRPIEHALESINAPTSFKE